MSLINEMLKDLEDRGETNAGAEDVRIPSRASRTGGARWLVAMLGALVLALGLLSGVLLWSGEREGSAQVAGAERPAPVPERDASLASPAPAADEPARRDTTAVVDPGLPLPANDRRDDIALTGQDTPAETPPEDALAGPETASSGPGETTAAPAEAASNKTSAEDGEDGSLLVRRHQPTPAERAERAGREGFAALRRGDWRTASRLLGELVSLEPANDDAREGFAAALVRQGRLAEADGVLLDGLAEGTRPARFAKIRARMQVARGEPDAALDSLSVAVPEVAADPEYHALKGAIAQQAGRPRLAAQIYAALTEFEPANGTWQAGRGMALDELGDRDGAREAYARALKTRELEPALLEHVRDRLDSLSAE